MKTRKWKIGMLMMVVAVLLTAQVASADYSLAVYGSTYQNGNGGEFWAVPNGGLQWLINYPAYDPAMLNKPAYEPDAFATFCVEKQEYLSPFGTSYYAELSDQVKNNKRATAIDLPKSVAGLYYYFATGKLDDMGLADYSTATKRWTSAGELQDAIWYLLGETTSTTTPTGAIIASYATTKWGTGLNYDTMTGKRAFPVMVVNLWSSKAASEGVVSDQWKQDQLALVSEPGILLLLGTGMLGLALVGRKTRRQRA